MSITVYNPTKSPVPEQAQTAPRPLSLENKTLGLIDNGKRNADTVLQYIGRHLKERFQLKEIITVKKSSFSHAIPDREADQLKKQCDLVISGIGD
ncbi:hypothetical protein SAMN05216352_106140 [Alteribacillus bidgolensis]|nr:hypothetical protein SAMN05216352_106140 [Alteribacillus bidgolensis]